MSGLALWLAVRLGIPKLAAYVVMGGIVILILGGIYGTWKGITAHYYNAGYDASEKKWKEKQLEATIARLELELRIAKQSGETDETIKGTLQDEIDKQGKLISELRDKLRKSGNACRLGDDFIRLR